MPSKKKKKKNWTSFYASKKTFFTTAEDIKIPEQLNNTISRL